MAELKLPTEVVSLPSKGLLYAKDSPLAKGEVEMKYMTAKEEDILSNVNYIKNGTVIDKLLQSLIVTPINYDDLLIGDKNAILIAARVLGYGAEYEFKYTNGRGDELEAKVDLSKLEEKQIDESLFKAGTNEFTFDLPKSGNTVTFKLLTHGDEKKIEDEIKGLKKINPNSSPDITTRMKHMITSINGNREQKEIRNFVDNFLLAAEARALREYYAKIQPDIELKFIPDDELMKKIKSSLTFQVTGGKKGKPGLKEALDRRLAAVFLKYKDKSFPMNYRTGRDLAEVEKQRSYEIQILNKAREYAKNPNNASKPLLFSITQSEGEYVIKIKGFVKDYKTDLLIFTDNKKVYVFDNKNVDASGDHFKIPSDNLIYELV